VLNRQTSSHHLFLEVGRLHVPIPVPPNHLPGVDEVPQIEVLESIMADSLALSSSTNLSKKRIREVTIPPAKLVTVDVERDGGGDRLTREAGSTRWFGSLTTQRTRSGGAGRSLAMRRGNGGRLAIDHVEGVIETGSIVEGHAYSIVWVVVLVGVAEWWNDRDLPTNEQSLYVSHFGATILHHSHRAHNPSPPTPISTAPICAHVHSTALINPQ